MTARYPALILCCFISILIVQTCSSSARYRAESIRKGEIQGNYYNGMQMRGTVSYYGEEFHGRKTASGEIYNMYAYTAAHKSLPFGTKIQVTNVENNRSVIVRINDRGPFVSGRILDLSYRDCRG
jgi:rare lipoprotein A